MDVFHSYELTDIVYQSRDPELEDILKRVLESTCSSTYIKNEPLEDVDTS